ncbi:hypothetical protein DL767_003889 [Monosporascus sp. MG133]|nr:hypothetical protein DL767_003889 [Monosporascus sp. MG133]
MSHNLTTDDWARFKTEIYSLYIVENRPLPGDNGVIKLMDTRFNFKKSKSQYETRLKEWGFEKYSKGTPAEDFKIASYRVNKAKTCGKLKAFEQASTPPTPPDFSFRMPTASPESQHPATPSAIECQSAPQQGSSSAGPDSGTTTPQSPAADTLPITSSQQVSSPALLDLSIIHATSSFIGQSPGPASQLLSESVQSSVLTSQVLRSGPVFLQSYSGQNVLQEHTVPAVTEPISYRYRQEDEDRIREDLLTMEMLYGTAHSGTLSALLELGEVLIDQGRQGPLKKAESLDVQVMEISIRILGKEHPHTLTYIGNLAATYRDQGRLKEAESLDVQVVEISIRILGKEHPDTLASMSCLASTYRRQGRLKEAESLDVQVMEMSIRILGKEHPDTLTNIGNLA